MEEEGDSSMKGEWMFNGGWGFEEKVLGQKNEGVNIESLESASCWDKQRLIGEMLASGNVKRKKEKL